MHGPKIRSHIQRIQLQTVHERKVTESADFRCCVNLRVYPTDQIENPNLVESLARQPEPGIK